LQNFSAKEKDRNYSYIMEQLSLHIEYLLLRHDCVIVPGFGAFINVRESAHVDRFTGVIYPGTREVRFNGSLTHDDGLLAGSFARREQVSFAEGREMLRQEIAALSSTLTGDGEVTLGGLGILRKDIEGHVTFHPFRTAAESSREMGYYVAPIAGEKVKEKVGKGKSGKEKETVAASNGRVFDTTRNYYIAINKVFARTAASFLLIIAVAMALLIPDYGSGKENQASVVPLDEVVRTAREKIVEPTVEVKAVEKEEVAPVVKSRPYHVIVAAFHNERDANLFISQHADSKYSLEALTSKKMCRVSAKSASTAAELQNTLRDKEFVAEYGECWIWEDKSAK
jgi:hypothetical protein